MFSVSEHYRSAINNSNPSYLTGSITFKDGSTRELTMADIAIGGPSITMQAVTQTHHRSKPLKRLFCVNRKYRKSWYCYWICKSR